MREGPTDGGHTRGPNKGARTKEHSITTDHRTRRTHTLTHVTRGPAAAIMARNNTKHRAVLDGSTTGHSTRINTRTNTGEGQQLQRPKHHWHHQPTILLLRVAGPRARSYTLSDSAVRPVSQFTTVRLQAQPKLPVLPTNPAAAPDYNPKQFACRNVLCGAFPSGS